MKNIINTIRDVFSNPGRALEAARGGNFLYYGAIKFAVFLRICVSEYSGNHCTSRASGIAFVLLITLIPLITTAAVLIASIADITPHHVERALSFLLPFAPPTVMEYITTFFVNSRKLRGIGIGVLIIMALSLFSIMEQALNAIWKVFRARSFLRRLRTFTMVIVYSPILFLLSYQLRHSGIFGLLPQDVFLMRIPPIIFTTLAFATLFWFIPNTRVRVKSAILGGVVSCMLFELERWGFGYYVNVSIQTHTMYGAFGLLVFFLLSLYFSALLFLIGAQVTYVHQNFRPLLRAAQRWDRRVGDYRCYITMRMLIDCIRAFMRKEPPPALGRLCESYELTAAQATGILNWLIHERFIHEIGGREKQYVPARDFSRDTVSEIFSAIENQHRRIPACPTDFTKEYLAEFMAEYSRRGLDNDLTLEELVNLIDAEPDGAPAEAGK